MLFPTTSTCTSLSLSLVLLLLLPLYAKSQASPYCYSVSAHTAPQQMTTPFTHEHNADILTLVGGYRLCIVSFLAAFDNIVISSNLPLAAAEYNGFGLYSWAQTVRVLCVFRLEMPRSMTTYSIHYCNLGVFVDGSHCTAIVWEIRSCVWPTPLFCIRPVVLRSWGSFVRSVTIHAHVGDRACTLWYWHWGI